MRAFSVCSGIGAPEVAWFDLPIDFVGCSEIEPFPCRILADRFPAVPNFGDMERIADGSVPVPAFDVLVGGTPCQSFSVAGLRGGLSDARGNLALSFCQIAARYSPEWVLWENVPGVLSSDDGRAFGSILGALVELGYGLAWRVLDAQNFGVPQRRRRVFLVGHSSGSVERARAVLFESEGVRRDPAPRSFPREDTTGCAAVGVGGDRAHALRSEGADAGEDGTGRGTPVIAFDTTQITSPGNRSACVPSAPSPTLAKNAHPPAVAFHHQQDPISGPVAPALGVGVDGVGVFVPEVAYCVTARAARSGDPTTDNYVAQLAPALTASNDPSRSPQSSEVTQQVAAVHAAIGRIRRLTPLECEHLQGFPDGWTDIPGASDSARYRALGNSMAVPVMEWIGRGLVGA